MFFFLLTVITSYPAIPCIHPFHCYISLFCCAVCCVLYHTA